MAAHRVFCSACDRDVTLVPRSPQPLLVVSLMEESAAEVECLDQGVTCTGALCPYGAVRPLEPQPAPARA